MTVKMLAKIFNYTSLEVYRTKHFSILHTLCGKRNLAEYTQFFPSKTYFLAADVGHFQPKLCDQMMVKIRGGWSWQIRRHQDNKWLIQISWLPSTSLCMYNLNTHTNHHLDEPTTFSTFLHRCKSGLIFDFAQRRMGVIRSINI